MKFNYPMLIPPFEAKDFKLMTKVEAKQYYDWFIIQQEDRCNLLMRAYKETGGDQDLDYTFDDLVPLWKWASGFFGTRDLTSIEKANWLEKTPVRLRGVIPEPKELTTSSMCLGVDIGFYVAELFMRKDQSIKWELFTKKGGPLNKPYLTGFKMPFVPYDLTISCVWSVCNGKKGETILFEACNVWLEDLNDNS